MNMLFYRIHAIHETSLLALTCILIFSHWCTCYYIQFKWSRVGLLMRGRPWNISLMCLKHRFNNQVVIRRHTWCRMAVFFYTHTLAHEVSVGNYFYTILVCVSYECTSSEKKESCLRFYSQFPKYNMENKKSKRRRGMMDKCLFLSI